MTPGQTARAAGVVLATLARVGLGALWITEAVLKWQAGFGRADILLVVSSTGRNPRVPDFYAFFTQNVLGAFPELFGVVVPLIEFGLGVLLVLGVFTLPVALASAAELINYWFADQLITQYPIMMGLSVVVATFSRVASRVSLTEFVLRRARREPSAAVRRWL